MAKLADQSFHGIPFLERAVVFRKKAANRRNAEIQVVDSAVGTERSPIASANVLLPSSGEH